MEACIQNAKAKIIVVITMNMARVHGQLATSNFLKAIKTVIPALILQMVVEK